MRRGEEPISAYYGGPVREASVGVVGANAACMIVRRGWFALEGFARDAAGFVAALAALVPAGAGTVIGRPRSGS